MKKKNVLFSSQYLFVKFSIFIFVLGSIFNFSMRFVFATVILCLLLALCFATDTTPRIEHLKDLPKTYLYFSPLRNRYFTSKSKLVDQKMYELRGVGQYNASMNEIGWDVLNVEAEDPFATGFLEGSLTEKRLATIDFNGFLPPGDAPVAQFIEEHYNYMNAMVARHASACPKIVRQSLPYNEVNFWCMVGRVLRQINGIAAGYNSRGGNVTNYQMFLLNFNNEIGDVQSKLGVPRALQKDPLRGQHCSGFVRVTADDVFASQDTWGPLTSMASRIFKVYNIGLSTVQMSSYTGMVYSGDDWYQTSNRLIVLETTNEVFNQSLFAAVTSRSASEFLRVMAATHAAASAKEWVQFFSFNNSGTYNNQWMALDLNKFVPGAPTLAPDTFWVAEQIPGYIASADVTVVLEQQGYWASYNFAYFKYIYEVSGYVEQEKQVGTFWSYTQYARPRIFKRNHTDVVDLPSMQRLMRFNNFQHDPMSLIPNCSGTPGGKCDPPYSGMLSVSARGDLNPSDATSHYGPLARFVGQIKNFGGIDSKIGSYKMNKQMEAVFIAGPTNDQQPCFAWSTSPWPELRPAGSVDKYDFPWIKIVPN